MDRKPLPAALPEEVGIRSADILSYLDALESSDTEMHGLMILRSGKVCCQGWWAPYGPGLRHGLQSHTKTYAATAVGIACFEGLLTLDASQGSCCTSKSIEAGLLLLVLSRMKNKLLFKRISKVIHKFLIIL